ncbi:peptidoglycan recognition protein 3-like isoform X2 [Dendrobates tinctorius]|uniref:peptidoglycan recognition protein 3-like isoform X2 n=1 Tax=Dendrobates tinctorius TaxID=92724 RepID=UPI003CC9B587
MICPAPGGSGVTSEVPPRPLRALTDLYKGRWEHQRPRSKECRPGGCPNIVKSSSWSTKNTNCKSGLMTPVPWVIVHHTDTPTCQTKDSCTAQVRSIQDHHTRNRKYCDIGYNFIIGNDSTIFEGRGWTKLGAHAQGFNSKSIGISFIGNFLSCPTIVTRAQWGGKNPTCRSYLRTPVPNVIIHHTEGAFCNSRTTCSAQVRNIQNYHMKSRGWCDIGYNFLIGEDGLVYEGRGWTTLGAHATSYNPISTGISVIGSFTGSFLFFQTVLPTLRLLTQQGASSLVGSPKISSRGVMH